MGKCASKTVEIFKCIVKLMSLLDKEAVDGKFFERARKYNLMQLGGQTDEYVGHYEGVLVSGCGHFNLQMVLEALWILSLLVLPASVDHFLNEIKELVLRDDTSGVFGGECQVHWLCIAEQRCDGYQDLETLLMLRLGYPEIFFVLDFVVMGLFQHTVVNHRKQILPLFHGRQV